MEMVPVHESYQDYKPPRYARLAIEQLLSDLPQKYQAGLQSVVLTNAAAIGRGKTMRVRGRKHRRNECRGFYHPKWKNEQPWIEIVVDNTIKSIPPFGKHIPLMREATIGEVLFHEVGHHIDRTLGSPARGGETPAETWSKRLTYAYLRRRYWYIVPFARILSRLLGSILKLRKPANT